MSARLITAKQVAERLNLRVSTVYAAANDGRIPCIRLWKGQRRALLRFAEKDIDALIDARKFPATRDEE